MSALASANSAGKFITFFGSARLADDHAACLSAYECARFLAQRGCGIITGGGGGIMQAANRGAASCGAASIGINIRLPHEQATNPFCTQSELHTSMNERKKQLVSRAAGFVVCAGGFGTLDELFEVLTLSQTGLDAKPIVLLGTEFWRPLVGGFFAQLAAMGLIGTEELFLLSDDHSEIARYLGV